MVGGGEVIAIDRTDYSRNAVDARTDIGVRNVNGFLIDHTRATRSRTLSRATRRTDSVLRVVRELFAQARPRIAAEGLTLLGVSLSGLRDDDGAQLELPLDGSRAGLDAAVDGVRERYGSGALRRAVVVHRDLGPEVPTLPDGEE